MIQLIKKSALIVTLLLVITWNSQFLVLQCTVLNSYFRAGREKLTSVPSGGGVAASSGGAGADDKSKFIFAWLFSQFLLTGYNLPMNGQLLLKHHTWKLDFCIYQNLAGNVILIMHDITNMVKSSSTWRISSLTCQRDKLLYNTTFLLIVLVQLYPPTNIYKIGKIRSWCPHTKSEKMFCVKVYCLHYLEVQLVCNGCPQKC